MMRNARSTVLIYGLCLAAGTFALRWLEYRYTVRLFSAEIYIALIALGFTALGVWLGQRLTRRGAPAPFARNVQALGYLGISERECQVLTLLAAGLSNREIGARLFVSPNTVKTHLAHLYAKLAVSRRTQAIGKAKSLRLIP
jgi:DNA-binding CsgD family transcriptional regulator